MSLRVKHVHFYSGKLQWERDIPQDALDNLQNLANSDFHKNLGKIIHDIYLTGHNLFKDMPQGAFSLYHFSAFFTYYVVCTMSDMY